MHKPCLFSFNLSFWKLLILQNISKEGRQNLIDVHHIPSQFENFTTAQWTHICRFPSLGKPWLDLEYRCWTYEFLRRNSNVQHRYSNIGLFNSAPIFAKFDDFMIGLYTVRTPIVDQTLVQDLLLKIRLEYPSKSCQTKIKDLL